MRYSYFYIQIIYLIRGDILKKYLFPIAYTILIILVGCLITSILYYFNITSDKLNAVFLYVTSILAMFIGTIKLGKNLKYKGIISGLIYFSFWFVIMLFLSLVFFKTDFSIKNVIYYLVLLIFSILGGVLGKNMQEENSD